jgi:hypothetical protein
MRTQILRYVHTVVVPDVQSMGAGARVQHNAISGKVRQVATDILPAHAAVRGHKHVTPTDTSPHRVNRKVAGRIQLESLNVVRYSRDIPFGPETTMVEGGENLA